MAKHAILKMIDYPGADLKQAVKVANYIQSQDRTDASLVTTHCLPVENIGDSLSIIEKRWNPTGKRLFKHGVFSFGKPDLLPETALEVTKKILGIYSDYPWMAAVHTNCTRRIHSHFFLGCINLRTGKKFAQGPKDLRQFKEHYSQIAQRYGLPVLKGYEPEDDTTCDEWDNCADYQVMQPIEDVFISEPVIPVVPMNPLTEKQAQVIPQLMTRFCLDFERYYQLGFGKGRL